MLTSSISAYLNLIVSAIQVYVSMTASVQSDSLTHKTENCGLFIPGVVVILGYNFFFCLKIYNSVFYLLKGCLFVYLFFNVYLIYNFLCNTLPPSNVSQTCSRQVKAHLPSVNTPAR